MWRRRCSGAFRDNSMVFACNAGMVVSDDESSLTDCVNFLHLRTFFSGLLQSAK